MPRAPQLPSIDNMVDIINSTAGPLGVAVDVPIIAPRGTSSATVPATTEVEALLHSLDDAAAVGGRSATPHRTDIHENKLVQARLGIASGLHTALRCKHAPTAAHSLRVALGCSSWAAVLDLDTETRDLLEVAALLHDVGKIGVADRVLHKPGRLLPEEVDVMNRHTAMTVAILASCGVPDSILDIVRGARDRFDGAGGSPDRCGARIPLAARLLSIVDAYDSMTTDHVYRPARSRERALAELFQCAGSQFDPELVQKFSELFSQDQNLLTERLARRWLHGLNRAGNPLPWDAAQSATQTQPPKADSTSELFEKKLIDNMHDGVLFVDVHSKILLWNTGVERLTGVSSSAACGRTFLPSLLDMHNSHLGQIPDEECPVARAMESGVQSIGRVNIMGRQGHYVAVDLHMVPVRRNDGVLQGATVLLHDASPETSLEEKCQALHAQVAKDPLTQVANRAEFDRMLNNFIAAHQESQLPCSLIMSDIDHFKLINDTHGHQAGDAAIITFAALLKSMCRSGDLVARYGGEEFAVLCADCSNASAAQKAEQIRRSLAELKHAYLGNKIITASFGVTELQAGDTPETMLRRSDRALLQAKDQGRNQVVQLGGGMSEEKSAKKSWWPFHAWGGNALAEATLVTAVPIEVAVQKLRGFVSDQNAKITKADENQLILEVTDLNIGSNRRSTDRSVTFVIEMQFSQRHVDRANTQGLAAGKYLETRIEVAIRPRRERDRRRDTTVNKARQLLGSLKSYLMAQEDEGHWPDPVAEPVAAQ
jgi:diguanylate cyclase (GGDEF)-like protein/PAS domain S-box-containing protein/putative nucleotidyltransferase with HDIG domain